MSSISISPTSATVSHASPGQSVLFEAANATGPVSWQILAGSVIPPGMQFHGDGGAAGAWVTGQPTVAGVFTLTLLAQDNGQTPPQFASQAVVITVT